MSACPRRWCAVLLLLASPAAGERAEVWPTAGWPESDPAAQGVNEAVLQRLDAALASGQHGYSDSMLVIRNGRVVYEKSYPQDYAAAFRAQADQRRGPYHYFDPDWHPPTTRAARCTPCSR